MEITGVGLGVAVGLDTFLPVGNAAENREVVLAVHALNATEMFGENQLRFQRDPESHRMIVRVVNTRTDEVLMQIPSEHLLRMAEELKKLSR